MDAKPYFMKIPDRIYHHLAAVAGFIIVALIYFYPVLQGKEISQSDIVQYTGMAKEQNDFRAQENAEPYWTNSAFGGMPTYQLGAKYPHNYIKMLDSAIRFLPRPADYLFLYFLSFYVLLIILKADPLKAFFGALAFGLSTYMVIILGVGHNAKAHAIGYMPLVVGGVVLVFRQHFIAGGLLTLFAAALEINANHFQMTYYLLIFLLILGAIYACDLVKRKMLRELAKALGVFLVAGIVALGANATNLLATSEYAKYSTRGKSDLTLTPEGTPRVSQSGMSREYITEYSYGIAESLNLVVPRLFGGSNSENLGEDSAVYQWIVGQGYPEEQAREFASGLPTYWGDQPIVAAPAYIGSIVFLLAVVGILLVRGRIKYALAVGALVSLVLSWGKNFGLITDLMIDYFPLYDKFRAISSIQVILELCLPALAILGLHAYFRADKADRIRALKVTGGVAIGLLVALFALKGTFSFSGGSDEMFLKNFGLDFVNALKADRESLYAADLLRSGFFMLLTLLILWLTTADKVKQQTGVLIIGILMVADLFFMAKNYVDSDSFVAGRLVREPFEATEADRRIMEDTTHYRVFELDGNLNSARASFFHSSIGGYHAAKPRRMQELFDYQIARNNIEVLNMLNVKYVLQSDKEGQMQPVFNDEAYGNAWFVSKIVKVTSADAEIKALSALNRNTAIINQTEFNNLPSAVTADSSATIKLVAYKPNHLKYVSNNRSAGMALFSEMYYPHGWNAYIDGKAAPHFRANYALRAMLIPAGKHVIEFKFEPSVISTGGSIALASSAIMLLLLAGGIYWTTKNKS